MAINWSNRIDIQAFRDIFVGVAVSEEVDKHGQKTFRVKYKGFTCESPSLISLGAQLWGLTQDAPTARCTPNRIDISVPAQPPPPDYKDVQIRKIANAKAADAAKRPGKPLIVAIKRR